MRNTFEQVVPRPAGDPALALRCLRDWINYYESLYCLYKLRDEQRQCICRPVGASDGETHVLNPNCKAHG